MKRIKRIKKLKFLQVNEEMKAQMITKNVKDYETSLITEKAQVRQMDARDKEIAQLLNCLACRH